MQKVAFLGQNGSFSSLVAKKYFKDNFVPTSCSQARDLFEAIVRGSADIAIIPIENTVGSSVLEHYDLFYDYEDKVEIFREVYLAIEHQLIGLDTSSLEVIDTVYAHPQAFLQCSYFLQNYSHWNLKEMANTSQAMQQVLEQNLANIALIGSKKIINGSNNLKILASNIHNHKNNYTRFLLICKKCQTQTSSRVDKCSICFKLKHQPKSLLSALQIISQDYINLTKIESRPIPGTIFEYIFYVDFEFEPQRLRQVKLILQELRNNTIELKNFGFYKKGRQNNYK